MPRNSGTRERQKRSDNASKRGLFWPTAACLVFLSKLSTKVNLTMPPGGQRKAPLAVLPTTPPAANAALDRNYFSPTPLLPGQEESKKATETDPWKRTLLERLERIRSICGELCSINDLAALESRLLRPAPHPGFAGRIQVQHDCPAILDSVDLDVGDDSVPYPPPPELIPYYTMNGTIPFHLKKRYTDTVYLGGQARDNVWSQQRIQEGFRQLRQGRFRGSYAEGVTMTVAEHLGQLNLTGKQVLVVGSETPWVETIALYHGAAMVTTLEYGVIISQHPQIRTMTPADFRTSYQNNTLGLFDAVLSFSSLEHPGLGRYGDALNPWADLLAVARAWCVTKPKGLLYLGLPTLPSWKDSVEFNGHRVYGKIRWPLITANWKQIRGIREKFMGIAGMGLLFEKVTPGEPVGAPSQTQGPTTFCNYCPSGLGVFTCRERANYLMQRHGLSNHQAQNITITQANTAEKCQIL